MNVQKKEEILQKLVLFCANARAEGKDDYQIQQEVQKLTEMDSKAAQELVELSKQFTAQKPSKVMPVLGMLAGLVVAGIGIGITMGSDGQVIAYGAIIVGILWFFKGLINVFE